MDIRRAAGAGGLTRTADELDRINDQIADIYAARTGKEKDEISALMTAETWMSGAEALNMGFVDELIENKKIAACVNSEKWFALYKHAAEGTAGKQGA